MAVLANPRLNPVQLDYNRVGGDIIAFRKPRLILFLYSREKKHARNFWRAPPPIVPRTYKSHVQVLETLVEHGAPDRILVDGKPHLGTDR